MPRKATEQHSDRYGKPVDFRLRIADALHAQVQAKAKEGAQSMNAWIVDAVEQKLASGMRSTDPTNRLRRIEHDVRDLKKRLKKLEGD